MSSTLFDYEWQFLLQMILRITYCETYCGTCETLLQQMKTLIPYQTGVIFKAGRENGSAVLSDPISAETAGKTFGHAFFIEGGYPQWNEFIMAPYSAVFRQSDVISPALMEKTKVYREIWMPRNFYWGLFISLVCKGYPLAVIGIMREKNEVDFSARDIYILNTLKDAFERKFYSLFEGKKNYSGNNPHPEGISKAALRFGLTKREAEIVALVCCSKSSGDICQQLYITYATLSKHLSNIYAKTKVRNRTQLFGLFNDV